MNFDLTEEQRMIRDTVRDFAEREIKPVAPALDEKGEVINVTRPHCIGGVYAGCYGSGCFRAVVGFSQIGLSDGRR